MSRLKNLIKCSVNWLNSYRKEVIISLCLIDIVVILILVYKLIYVASKIPDSFTYSPIQTSNALIYYLVYIPEFLIHCLVNPYTGQAVAFFFQYEILVILILNLLVIYFYYKWYIFVFKSRFFRRIFWGLATFIYLIASIDLVTYIMYVYPHVIIVTDDKFALYAFYFFVLIYIIIYKWLIYLPETEEEKKRREEDAKSFRQRK